MGPNLHSPQLQEMGFSKVLTLSFDWGIVAQLEGILFLKKSIYFRSVYFVKKN